MRLPEIYERFYDSIVTRINNKMTLPYNVDSYEGLNLWNLSHCLWNHKQRILFVLV